VATHNKSINFAPSAPAFAVDSFGAPENLVIFLRRLFVGIWWLAIGYLPITQFRFTRTYSEAIGCPKQGDCYVPGSEHLLSLDIQFLASAFLLWPTCLWFLVVRPLLLLVRKPDSTSTNTQ